MAERQRRKTIKVPLLVLLLYMLIGGVFLATSTGSFVVNFKDDARVIGETADN